MRGEAKIHSVDHEWERRVFDWLEKRAAERDPLSRLTLVWDLPSLVEPDPFFDRPPRRWRAALRWMWLCALYAWRRETNTLDEFPVMRWQLEGVVLWHITTAELRFGVDVGGP